MESISRRIWLACLALGLGAMLCAVGAKLALIQRYGTDQPYADQWAAEGMYFLRGPLYYNITLSQLTSLHGEHRPGLMRLWVRGGILANDGQWDCYLELVANLLIYAAYLLVLWRWVVALVERAWLPLVALLMAVLFGLPCAYENFLWSFQSHFMFLLLLGLVHVAGTMSHRRFGGRWWSAQVAGFLGLFSIAAGAMSAAALVALMILEVLRGDRSRWVWTTLAVNLVLFGFGFWLIPSSPDASRLEHLLLAFRSLGYLLSWPFARAWWCLFLQAPWIILLFRGWRSRSGTEAATDMRLGAIGLWVTAIAFAIAYGRGVQAENIGVRYYDVLVLGLFVNVPALARLLSVGAGRHRFFWSVFAGMWLIFLSLQLWRHNRPADLVNMFEFQHREAIEQQNVVREFLTSNDPSKLKEFEDRTHRFPHFQTTLDFLRDPKVPMLLPPSLAPDRHANPLSVLARRVAGDWEILMALGIVCGGLGAAGVWRRSPAPLRAAKS